jgi:hypothetical protein
MKSTEFCYWLQGFFELRKAGLPQMAGTSLPAGGITADQAEMIERHLALVFKHDIDPQAGPSEVQAELQAIHDGKPTVGGVAPHSGLVMRC